MGNLDSQDEAVKSELPKCHSEVGNDNILGDVGFILAPLHSVETSNFSLRVAFLFSFFVISCHVLTNACCFLLAVAFLGVTFFCKEKKKTVKACVHQS